MTLIVALGCNDGIVMGADSASTDAMSGTKQPDTKSNKSEAAQFFVAGLEMWACYKRSSKN